MSEPERTLLERAEAGELLTIQELATLLKKRVSWIHDHRRPGQPDPLPAVLPRPLTFRWSMILEWLDRQAEADRKAQLRKRNRPVRRRPRKKSAPKKIGSQAELAASLSEVYSVPKKAIDIRLKRGETECVHDTKAAQS